MELSILAENDRKIRIMDGSHLTTILKLNSLLSANDAEAADQPYVKALSNFLQINYEKIIPDIPDIIRSAFSNDAIIGLTKYSSSREIIDTLLSGLEINADDKVFMSIILSENEYTRPISVGNSKKIRPYGDKCTSFAILRLKGLIMKTCSIHFWRNVLHLLRLPIIIPNRNCIFVTISHILIPLLTVLKSRKIWRKTKKIRIFFA